MDNLPIELIYEILAFSGLGTLRYGFPQYDDVMKPCKFIFKLHNRNLKIKPIASGYKSAKRNIWKPPSRAFLGN